MKYFLFLVIQVEPLKSFLQKALISSPTPLRSVISPSAPPTLLVKQILLRIAFDYLEAHSVELRMRTINFFLHLHVQANGKPMSGGGGGNGGPTCDGSKIFPNKKADGGTAEQKKGQKMGSTLVFNCADLTTIVYTCGKLGFTSEGICYDPATSCSQILKQVNNAKSIVFAHMHKSIPHPKTCTHQLNHKPKHRPSTKTIQSQTPDNHHPRTRRPSPAFTNSRTSTKKIPSRPTVT